MVTQDKMGQFYDDFKVEGDRYMRRKWSNPPGCGQVINMRQASSKTEAAMTGESSSLSTRLWTASTTSSSLGQVQHPARQLLRPRGFAGG